MTEWKFKDAEFKSILNRNDDEDNETESVANSKRELLAHIKSNPIYQDLPETVIKKMQGARTFHSFNRALSNIYDFADMKRIWLGL